MRSRDEHMEAPSVVMASEASSSSKSDAWRKTDSNMPTFKTGDMGAFNSWKTEFIAWSASKGKDMVLPCHSDQKKLQ